MYGDATFNVPGSEDYDGLSEKELIKELVDAGREGKKDKEFLKNHIDETFAANEKKQSRV